MDMRASDARGVVENARVEGRTLRAARRAVNILGVGAGVLEAGGGGIELAGRGGMGKWVRVYKLLVGGVFATESARPYRAARAPRLYHGQTVCRNPETKFVPDGDAFV